MTFAVASSPLLVITEGGTSSAKSNGDYSMVAGVPEDPNATVVSPISMTRLAVTVSSGQREVESQSSPWKLHNKVLWAMQLRMQALRYTILGDKPVVGPHVPSFSRFCRFLINGSYYYATGLNIRLKRLRVPMKVRGICSLGTVIAVPTTATSPRLGGHDDVSYGPARPTHTIIGLVADNGPPAQASRSRTYGSRLPAHCP
nr:hypothetical protein [Tanacetum cinerariifolium]